MSDEPVAPATSFSWDALEVDRPVDRALRQRVVGEPGTEANREETRVAGQVMTSPPFVPHGVTALEPSMVLDPFSLPSEKTGVDRD